MANHRWILQGYSLGVIRFPINPREGALPNFEKKVTVHTSSLGAPIFFEGRQEPQRMPFTGSILTQEHYQFFKSWFDHDYAVTITDDLGQTVNAYLVKFTPKRKNRHSHPWAADYDCEAIVWEN